MEPVEDDLEIKTEIRFWPRPTHESRKATKITIHRADGSVWMAKGEVAEQIDEHWAALEILAFNHGMVYKGPCLKQACGPRTGPASKPKEGADEEA